MLNGETVFTPLERRAAMLALVAAALAVALGGLAQRWIEPSVGATETPSRAPPPGVLQARPLTG